MQRLAKTEDENAYKLGEFISNHSELVGILVEAYAAFKLGSTIKQLYSLAKAFAITKAAKLADKISQAI